MFILPFIRVPQLSPGLEQVWLFLERNGTHLIQSDSATPEEGILFAKEFSGLNGLVLEREPWCVNNVVFCPIKIDSPELTNFYTWKETPAGTTPPKEVWRSFLWITSKENTDPWGVNKLTESILLSESQSVFSVLSVISGL